MKLLTWSFLLLAMVALSRAAGKSDVVKRAAPCNQGWTSINGRLFIYISTPMTWAQAERNCISLGGTLASVHSAQEYSDIQRLILSATSASKETWIGGSDAQEEGVWLWADGSSFGYSHWCQGEPSNGYKMQHCLQMNYSDSKCWDDHLCNVRLPSVCSTRK
ncbi:ladderlectin-like isoform 2-T2 [Odontesthes bonariensis]|uniref:ladderlectin-like isoform X2 n=1 Tax=Odontesthes bonariensis TaxID=219752 RepID=UPI003F5806B9